MGCRDRLEHLHRAPLILTVRVLHCIYDDPGNPWVGGGGAVRVREIYRRLTERVSVTVATGSYPGAADQTVEGIRYARHGARSPYTWSRLTYALAANRLLRWERYDAAVFDFSSYTPIFVPTDRPTGITVHHLSGETAAERWGGLVAPGIRQLERGMLRRGRWLSATSQATREHLRRVVPGARIVPVGAGVPDELFTLERREKEYLLYFGRLDWFQKGLDVLLGAVALLVAERPELEMWIAGRGKDAPRVETMARRLGIDRNLRLLGGVSDSERMALLSGARVLLMPSRFEGFGMVAAEAMAAGVPVVAAAVGSLPEVVAPPEGGVLVPPGDAEALATATAALLDDDERRRVLSIAARRSAERFRWAAVAQQHLEFLELIAADAPASHP